MNPDRSDAPGQAEPPIMTWEDVDAPSALGDPPPGWGDDDDVPRVLIDPLPVVGRASPDDVPSALEILDGDETEGA